MNTRTPTCYFGNPSIGARPLDGLHDALSVLEAVSTLIGNCNSLDGFERADGNNSLHGLNVILSSASHAIMTASDEIWEEHKNRTGGSHTEAPQGLARGGERNVDAFLRDQVEKAASYHQKDKTYPRVLTAKEAAIVETFRQGYETGDIGQAVNLKKQNVERIIEKLRGEEILPTESESSPPRAATA